MTDERHKHMVKMLHKSGISILEMLTPHRVNMIHAAVGISGEAGELLDAIKKVFVYNKKLDRVNVIEELGDLEFYMEQLRQELEITREECLEYNMNKLAERYTDYIYSDEAARIRKDKI